MITNYKVYTTTDLADVLISNTIFNDYQLWGWGTGADGRLGDNTTAGKSSPVQTVTAGATWRTGSAGGAHTGAIKTDGTLWLWGANIAGQLGNNTNTDTSSPVQTVAGGSNWAYVAAGAGGQHVAAVKTDGTLWLWGLGTSGQLGDNTQVSKSSPVQTVAGGSTWRTVWLGDTHTFAIKT